jgi:hypothetical protein
VFIPGKPFQPPEAYNRKGLLVGKLWPFLQTLDFPGNAC